MKHLAALFSLLLLAGIAQADSFVYVKRTNWTPQAFGIPQFQTNGTSITMVASQWFTNMVPSYEFETRTNIVAAIETVAKASKDSGFEFGEIIVYLVLALLGAGAKWQQLRAKKLNRVLGQHVETYSEVTKAQPGGEALDKKIKIEIVSQQVDADVKKMAADVRENKVNPGAARQAAERVMA